MPAAKKTAAVQPVADEATEAPTSFEYRGVKFDVPHPLDFPLEVLEAEDEVQILRLVLGDDQWTAFKETKPTVRHFQGLVERVNGSTGN